MATRIAYRISDWDTPLRVNPNRTAGRYNESGSPATQYFGLHPLTPWAEYLRANDLRDTERLAERRLRIWVIELDLSDSLWIGFDDAQRFDIEPEDLVGEDHEPCRRLAERLRADPQAPSTIVVPSAALPGTEVAVVFGERVAIPFGWVPIDAGDVPTCVIAERSQPPPGIAAHVRYRGEPHRGLLAWLRGSELTPPALD